VASRSLLLVRWWRAEAYSWSRTAGEWTRSVGVGEWRRTEHASCNALKGGSVLEICCRPTHRPMKPRRPVGRKLRFHRGSSSSQDRPDSRVFFHRCPHHHHFTRLCREGLERRLLRGEAPTRSAPASKVRSLPSRVTCCPSSV
jgi:hypothetical protein